MIPEPLPQPGKYRDQKANQVNSYPVHNPEQVANERSPHITAPPIFAPYLDPNNGLAQGCAKNTFHNPKVQQGKDSGGNEGQHRRFAFQSKPVFSDSSPAGSDPHPRQGKFGSN